MLLIPSRKWINEQISSFICCETGPWTSLWVRFWLLMCPECRKEHRELKQVWSQLDAWQVDPINDNLDQMEENFSQTLRSKFPAAFEQSSQITPPKTADLVLRFGYATAIVALGITIFLVKVDSPNQPLQLATSQPVIKEKVVSAAPITNEIKEGVSPLGESQLTVAAADSTPERMRRPVDVYDPIEDMQDPGFQVRITSTSPAPRNPNPLHNQHLSKYKHAIEINDVPFVGFETLLVADEDQPY